MIINFAVRFFDSRNKVNLTWDSKTRHSDFRSKSLVTEPENLAQGRSSTVNVYTRSDIEADKYVPGC